MVSVIDQGHGIDESDLRQLFSAFSRLEAQIGGTGLGLCISKSLIELMNGTISAQSKVGVGSVFFFEVPCSFGLGDKLKGEKRG